MKGAYGASKGKLALQRSVIAFVDLLGMKEKNGRQNRYFVSAPTAGASVHK